MVGLFDVPNCATKSGCHFLGKEHQACRKCFFLPSNKFWMGGRKSHLGEAAIKEVGRCLLNVGQAVITVCLPHLLGNSLQKLEGEKSMC